MTRREELPEEVEQYTYDGPRVLNTPPPRTRPEQLLAAPGPQAAVTVGYVAAEAPSLIVAPVAAHDGLDEAISPPAVAVCCRCRGG